MEISSRSVLLTQSEVPRSKYDDNCAEARGWFAAAAAAAEHVWCGCVDEDEQ